MPLEKKGCRFLDIWIYGGRNAEGDTRTLRMRVYWAKKKGALGAYIRCLDFRLALVFENYFLEIYTTSVVGYYSLTQDAIVATHSGFGLHI